jgi:hypothetical protein
MTPERWQQIRPGGSGLLSADWAPPFDEGNGIGVMIAHARDAVVPPSRDRADVPEDLERVVLRCLAKEPTERFPDAESLEIPLGRCLCASSWNKALARQWWSVSVPDHCRSPNFVTNFCDRPNPFKS